jgi:hypothetical protein
LVRFLIKSAPNRGNTRGSHDVVGEYAVYMMVYDSQSRLNARKNGPSGGLARAANLDASPLSPYTSAVPWMDVILNPAPHPKKGMEGGMEEDLVRCRGAVN